MTAIPTSTLSNDIRRLADVPPETMLRGILRTDALISGANGIAYVAAASVLDEVLGLPAPFLRGVGVFLVLFAVTVWAVGSRTPTAVSAVRELIAANLLWTVASLALVLSGAADLTGVGAAWVVLQAVVVLGLAGAQAWALGRVADA